MMIRRAENRDREDIRGVHLHAFSEDENQQVATLATNLLDEETNPQTISLVAEISGCVVGHVAFSRRMAEAVDRNWSGYILAPLGVKPEWHRTGIGAKLISSGVEILSGQKINVLFVYGDPRYYSRFGFSVEAASQFIPPYELQYPLGWQAKVLLQGGLADQTVKLSCVPSLRDPALW